jgi:hypothetical protein
VIVAASGRILSVFLPGERQGEDELGEPPYR